jgi:hypothetical protein
MRLSPAIREQARIAWRLFDHDPSHPSLRFKKLRGREDLWSARINAQYRAVGVRSGDTIQWIWIGTHNEFAALFSN